MNAPNPARKTLALLPRGQRVPAARAVVRELRPYLTVGVESLGFQEAPGLGTVAVTKHSQLLVDLDAVACETPLELATGLIHEYMHIYLDHSARFQVLVRSGAAQESDGALWNKAADGEINDGLIDSGLPSTFGPNSLVTPQSFGCAPNLTAEIYFAHLKANPPPAQSKPCCGSGWCGSGAGNPVEGEPGAPAPAQSTMSAPSAGEVRAQVDSAVQQYAKANGWGSVPASIRRAVEARATPAVVSWQSKLAKFARVAVHGVIGVDDYSADMRSRRQPKGCPFVLPEMVQLQAQVALAIDTSGSMGEDALLAIVTEAESILRAVPQSRVSAVVFDAEVQAVARVRSARELRGKLIGGGGTDFRVAFAALQKLKPRPDVVVFCTDGYGPYPEAPPPFPVVWLIVPGGRVSVPWGAQVELNPDRA